ncbi:zinc-alpha-2-glycoprotein-like [Hypanus sabinus]|uniref:zinc-alpha-2-glycoprotein-like n=1 Tax=Hypanus sabinus TaxID=79690 RepID=UPI0028C418DC|nr:zinc-alpha-2-glycoprotein-like [Hypanus sabinus]
MRALCSPSFLAFLGAVLSILEVVEATRSGLHILHQYCECTQRDHKTVVSWVDGYDGETIVYYDPDNKTFVATRRFAQRVVDKRNANSYFVESIPEQIASLCDRIKRLAISTNATWERKAPTHTRAFMQKKQGQMYLVCTAKNFFPRGIKVHWVRNGKVADSGSDMTNIVPQSNGTFQVRSVRSLDGDSQGYVCQMEHEAVSGKLVIPLEHKALVENEALIIVGAVLGILGLCAMAVTGILYCCTSEGPPHLLYRCHWCQYVPGCSPSPLRVA